MGKHQSKHADKCNINNRDPMKRTRRNKGGATRGTNIKENTPTVNRRRAKGKQLRHPLTTVKGSRNKRRQQKHLEYSTERKTLIIMEKGLRTLNIASVNPDAMRCKEIRKAIVKCLTKNKIHLAEMQETHITRDCNYMVGNYRVITAAADKNKETGIVTGGTAIMVRGSLPQEITQIARKRRALRVTLDHAKSKKPIHII